MSRSKAAWLSLVFAVIGCVSGAVALAKPAPPPPPPKPPNCRFVLCAYPDCLPGEHTEIPAGQCCPVCVPD